MTTVFIDTNVLCYVHDEKHPLKRARAMEVIASLKTAGFSPVISTQVLQEFYNVLVRRFRVEPEKAKRELIMLEQIHTVLMHPTIIYAAVDLHISASLSFWDSLVIAAAQSADCEELWTEDLQDGQRFGKLRVVNPFKGISEP